MSKYPHITDPNYYKQITKLFNEYKIKPQELTFEQYCSRKHFKLQLPQEFLSQYINPNTPYTSILIYHKIGAGKTCAAIQIAEQWKSFRKIIIVLPASLQTNFRNELRGFCGGDNYLTTSERNLLLSLHPNDKKYKEIIDLSNTRIDKFYHIYSFNKFIDNINDISLHNSLLIIDEIQNMISENGVYYQKLYDKIKSSPKDLRLVLMSATPIFDKPVELALIINLLRKTNELPTGTDFNKKFIKSSLHNDKQIYSIKNIDLFKQYIKGYISYFRGAPQFTFPYMTIKYKYCVMSKFQFDIYNNVLKNENLSSKKESFDIYDLPNQFFIGTRMVSNIVFPNKKLNQLGLDSLTDKHILYDLNKYSCKFYSMINKIQKSPGKIFIYSNFKEFGGIRSFIKILDTFGYKNFIDHGDGSSRYAIWSGDESLKIKNTIYNIFNMKENITGSKIKILLGSPSIKEGISLKEVRQVHIIEPYWNMSRLQQVIGRANRFCSHKELPEDKRNVKVYIYIAISPNNTQTVDQHIQSIANTKNKLISEFEQVLKESAIDCELNKNANITNSDFKCDK